MTAPPYITHHAYQRARERLGMGRPAFERLAARAWAQGRGCEECGGRLRHFLEVLGHDKGGEHRVCGQFLFVFDGTRLVTVYRLPPDLREATRGAR